MISFVVEDGTGLASATSYVSVEEADSIAALNIHNSDKWLALTLDVKRNLLMYTSRVLDTRTTWEGTQVNETQALAWPRSDVTDRYGNSLSAAAVPYAVRWAVVELAKHTMSSDRLSVSQPDSITTMVKVDTIEMEFADPTLNAMRQYKTPMIVSDILKGLGRVRNSAMKVTFGRAIRE